jgi:hypothetical protein
MALHSKLTRIKLETPGAVMTDISTYCDKFEKDEELDLSNVTTFGVNGKQWLAGFTDGTVKIGGPLTRASAQFFSALVEAFRDGTIDTAGLEYHPEGTSAGDVKETAEVIIKNYKESSSAEAALTWSADMQISGVVTHTTN